jgi:hypothetical protein
VASSLHILSLPPPLLSFGMNLTSIGGSYSCDMVYEKGELWSDYKDGSSSWSLDIPYIELTLKTVLVVIHYSSPSPVGGILTIRGKSSPDDYFICECSMNKVREKNIARIELKDVRMFKAYDSIAIVVNAVINDNVNILSAKCTIVY